MKVLLLLVGKTTNKHISACIDDYVGRIGHYLPFSIQVTGELKNTKNLSVSMQKEREGEQIMKYFQAGDHVVLLDEHGEERRSVEFASWLEHKHGPPVGVRDWRPLRLFRRRICPLRRASVALPHDLLPPNGAAGVCGADLPRLHHHSRRALSP